MASARSALRRRDRRIAALSRQVAALQQQLVASGGSGGKLALYQASGALAPVSRSRAQGIAVDQSVCTIDCLCASKHSRAESGPSCQVITFGSFHALHTACAHARCCHCAATAVSTTHCCMLQRQISVVSDIHTSRMADITSPVLRSHTIRMPAPSADVQQWRMHSLQIAGEEELDEAAPQQAVRGSRLTPAVTLSVLLAATVLCWLFLA